MPFNKCRTCGDWIFVPHSKNIFDKKHQDIRKKIEVLTGVALNNNKDLPQHICSCCLLDLQHAAFFRDRCIKAQRLFVEGTKQKTKLENDEDYANLSEEDVEDHDEPEDIPDEPGDTIDEADDTIDEPDDIKEEPDDTIDEPDDTVDEPDDSVDETDDSVDDPDDTIDEPDDTIDEPDDTIEDMLSEDEFPSQSKLAANTKYPRVLLKRLPASVTKIVKSPPVNQPPCKRKRKRYVNLEKKYTCEYCGWSFRDLGNMKAHKLTHMEQKFSCDQCERKFYTRPHLNLHIRVIHNFEKPFLCKYCGEGFPNSPSRCRHQRTFHADQLPFQCEICPKRFISKISLAKHIQTHKEGERIEKFFCNTCNREFKDKRVLSKHYDTNYHKSRLAEHLDLKREGSLDSDETIDEEFDLAENLMKGKWTTSK